MNPTILLSLLLVCVPLGIVAWFVLTVDRQGRAAVTNLLARGAAPTARATDYKPSVLEGVGRRLTPPTYVAFLDRLLALAGRPASMPLGKVLGTKLALGLAGVGLGLHLTAIGSTPLMKLAGLFVLFLGYFIPDLLLYSKGQERQKTMQLELANTLDQMLISVEAGLGFEGAMARAGDNGNGPLAEELVRTLQDMQVGRSRRESYTALAARTSIPELRSFVQAVVQADTYGIAISRVLRVQAKVMRVKRRQRAEEKAMKLPVMILFPLLFFIFPVLFIAILGPAVINTVVTFTGQ
ncbi:type II secretion system protein [Pseudarthrobacter chlorophenolicus A6]|uniref:Type II secretion system protein n=1 Tax=Pseudarthrobacter chlorophenolicus (strain ATCC 700700 / DSM 12829 / CIP 107037 / JCM 12360 / KCTC 9906 / NCIMB 13794 / A6) TaxID=452863 RepID=B8HCW9_PSECP|nr:type II secretion system F family protein [Pseudarthrobacter chlorophenolicus]ACL40615.1 type II secretion system protein [Pseudarthrobacter chlorophenolicus A6]SDQ78286.1 tight adherence protein C [Pseudarthrobacter chlorophenolicus]